MTAEIENATERAPDVGGVGVSAPALSLIRLDDEQAFNAELASATGDFVVVLSSGASIAAGALPRIARALQADSTIDVLYADEGYGDRSGNLGHIFKKPDFSPERLRGQMYFGGLVVYRRSLVEELGGYRTGFEGAESYDLALRATERARTVAHIPEVLSFTSAPSSVDRSSDAGRRAVADHLERTTGGEAESGSIPGTYRIRRTVAGNPLVSIVIPTRGSTAVIRNEDRCLVVEAVRGIVEASTYHHLEIVVVVDRETPGAVIDRLKELARDRLVVVPWSEPFSFSGKVNRGVVCSTGEYVLLLNDDTEVIAPEWIEVMLAIAQQPGIGMVGAMLYFEDGSIQHAGHLYDHGNAGHIGFGWPRGAEGPDGAFVIEREVSGVTAACSLLPRHVYLEVGGLSPVFPGNYNDVDLSMKVTGAGYRIVWTPWAELVHFESKTRVPTVGQRELRAIRDRWGHRMETDPYWPEGPHDYSA